MLTLYSPKYIPISDEQNVILTDEEGREIVLGDGGQYIALQVDDYYVKEKATGLDELYFDLNINDPAYAVIQELSNLVDSDFQRYLVRKIDGGKTTATIGCELDMDEWKADLKIGYTNGFATVQNTLENVAPDGWSIINNSGVTFRRTISGNMTPFEVLTNCIDTYGLYLRIDNHRKVVTLYPQEPGSPSGAFATRQLNLKEINYKGQAKHEDFCTRLYAIGKNGMTFADINGGMAYVDNFTYTDRVVCGVWEDDRYTDKQSLLEDATRRLKEMSVPARSYECEVVDLKAVDPEKYNFLDFGLFTTATLVDDIRETSINYQVVERWRYPHYPEKNKVIFSDVPVTVQNQVVQIREAIDNPNSSFRQGQAALVDSATNWLTSADGYLILVRNDDGSFKELLAMDTNNTETAKNVFRLNNNGIGFSTTGVNGPYTNAWTIDGNLIADFISGGTIEGQIIAKNLVMQGGSINLTTDTSDYDVIRLNFSGNQTLISPITMSVENSTAQVSTLQQSHGYMVYDIHESGTEDDVQRAFYGRTISLRDEGGSRVFYVGSSGSVTATGSLSVGDDLSVSGWCWLNKGATVYGNLHVQAGESADGNVYVDGFVMAPQFIALTDGQTMRYGVDGTYTFGSRTVTINGGIITSVT